MKTTRPMAPTLRAGALLLLALGAAGCVSKDVRETADLAAQRADEYVEMAKLTHEEVMSRVDSSMTLDRILDDPVGALCSWVQIQGTVLSPDLVDDYMKDDDIIYLGRVDKEAGIYKVLNINKMGADPDPKPGDRVNVVGKFFCTQVQFEKMGRDVAAYEGERKNYKLLTWWVVVLD